MNKKYAAFSSALEPQLNPFYRSADSRSSWNAEKMLLDDNEPQNPHQRDAQGRVPVSGYLFDHVGVSSNQEPALVRHLKDLLDITHRGCEILKASHGKDDDAILRQTRITKWLRLMETSGHMITGNPPGQQLSKLSCDAIWIQTREFGTLRFGTPHSESSVPSWRQEKFPLDGNVTNERLSSRINPRLNFLRTLLRRVILLTGSDSQNEAGSSQSFDRTSGSSSRLPSPVQKRIWGYYNRKLLNRAVVSILQKTGKEQPVDPQTMRLDLG